MKLLILIGSIDFDSPVSLAAKKMTENKQETSIYRVIDAGINRANEGARVIEDYLRMVLGDSHLASRLKSIRHDLTAATKTICADNLIASRDSEGDVGRQIKTESEYSREQTTDLIRSNFSRVQQALRSIEEFSKTISGDVAQRVEQLRYDSYTLEKAVLTTLFNLHDLGHARLYVLTDCRDDLGELKDLVAGLVRAGVDLIQLRDKGKSDRELIEAGKTLTGLLGNVPTRWIMNDRPDLARAAGADGVHLGQTDMSVSEARQILGPEKLIGVSTHSIEQARRGVLDGASYIGVGPVFQSATKDFDSLVGISLVKAVSEEIALPAFAIGGIGLTNIEQVIDAGLTRVAASSAVVAAADPEATAREMLAKLHSVSLS